jgi:hypothetical protein
VLGVESGLAGALATLEWASHETERRLIAGNRARQAGGAAPDETRRPLWIIADRPTALSHIAVAEERDDPQRWLQVPLRHGRAAQVTVVVADQFETAELLSDPVRAHTKARVVLGPATAEEVRAVLGAPPHTTPPAQVPPGRGYARLGNAPVLRLQVPATPDPLDDATGQAHREAVTALLPEHTMPADGAGPGEPVAGGKRVDVGKAVAAGPSARADGAEADDGSAAAKAPEAEESGSVAEPVGASARVRTDKGGEPRVIKGSVEAVRAEG